MCSINIYSSNQEFANNLAERGITHPHLLGYVRNEYTLFSAHEDWNIFSDRRGLNDCLRCLPVIGNILGIIKLQSVWSTKDPEDHIFDVVMHTISGVLETIGLGLIVVALKVVYSLFYTIFISIPSNILVRARPSKYY
ncbi:hypothetical protein CP10139811_0176 [Chlamydia ibidis]|uniref:Uncharacterized protein n=2 Tax=Chlamydia ibidis TaxID=1405396 RepID=S7KLK6_9CHLA|nr:hypothetical protein [Chlamydia ibidis]EPP35305.1 hypothetical protein CP10139811_0176 [Chlamydia ibidis]EQM62528.1 hypothetical protein H359_0618 [Chlamydia ibidis 10-1398/6]